jgi:hypothetical protein
MAPQIDTLTVKQCLRTIHGLLIQLELSLAENKHEEARRGLTHLGRIQRRAIKAIGKPEKWNRKKSWVENE